jgi:DNA-binding transcriptional LysR family regulator
MQPYAAVMQLSNWNDLRYLLAIKRGLTLTAAARQLGVDDTTVSRRLAALQSVMSTQLFLRNADGTWKLTPSGEAVVQHAEAMERQFDLIGQVLGADQGTCVGTVRVTSVPIVVHRLLVPEIGHLLNKHPGLQVELIPESRDLSLSRREADMAIRLARPATGGMSVKARRIGTFRYLPYSLQSHSPREAKYLPWITYDETMGHLPQARWMARAAKVGNGAVSPLKVHDAETALEAVLAGLGKTLLPTSIADRDKRLRRLQAVERQPFPSREVWLLAHADQLDLGRIVAAIAWVEEVVKAVGSR